MKRGLLSLDEVRHLEHRWCVLQSFLDLADDPKYANAIGHAKEGRIFRGCKDGAIATCRALCERFSISMSSNGWKSLKSCSEPFKKKVKSIHSSAMNHECESLWEVLVAANRCVCHLENKLIDHKVGNNELKDAISMIQAIVRAELKAAHLSSNVCK